jgi:hypothetical protein
MRKAPLFKYMGFGIAGLLILIFLSAYIVQEPLRAYIAKRMNQSLKGYTARIGSLDLQLKGLSVVLEDLAIHLGESPQPPLSDF